MRQFSKTQIDRLGDRLRRGNLTEDDLRLLDQYRRSFSSTYETVVRTIRDRLPLEPTGRPAKSTSSIIEKLRRESIRLTQVQDIAGCRVITTDINEQDRVVESLRDLFAGSTLVDRRQTPSHGYRAVHVITRGDKVIEIQVRSASQHVWAELSEKLSDVVDPTIKYGGGEDSVRKLLGQASDLVARVEELEKSSAGWRARRLRHRFVRLKSEMVEFFRQWISELDDKRD